MNHTVEISRRQLAKTLLRELGRAVPKEMDDPSLELISIRLPDVALFFKPRDLSEGPPLTLIEGSN